MTRSGAEGYSLFIRNVSKQARPNDLREIFERYAKVKDVYLPPDYHTRQPRGIAYVEFYPDAHMEKIVDQTDGIVLLGRDMRVKIAQGGRKDKGEMRHRDGGDRRYDSPGYRRRSRSFSRSAPSRRNYSPRRARYDSRDRSFSPRDRRRSPRRRYSPARNGGDSFNHGNGPSRRQRSRSPSPRRERYGSENDNDLSGWD